MFTAVRRKAEVLLFVFAIKPLDQIKTAVLLGIAGHDTHAANISGRKILNELLNQLVAMGVEISLGFDAQIA
ncbi:MAG TPA: hypothetical protein VIH63_03755 [Xanthobacteraceae bacterium]